jgi:hypothetical protein
MAGNQSVRLLERQILKASIASPGVDLGEFLTLEVSFQLVDAGGANEGTVRLQHAAADEEDLYVDVGNPFNVFGAAAGNYQSISFSKWVRCVSNAQVNGAPLVAIEIIAKEN